VKVQDGLPEQVPGALPTGATVQTAGGNYVVVDLGEGRFAFYAHMQPGSIRVKEGQRVGAGKVLGLLGNTGNTDGPHLHFHVMDGPSPLRSNGLPFTFTRYRGQGVVTDEAPLFAGASAPVDAAALAGKARGAMPLNDQLIKLK
jgi:murein DD-endopeptidase MepM/ murein hydrolase activator NlpD